MPAVRLSSCYKCVAWYWLWRCLISPLLLSSTSTLFLMLRSSCRMSSLRWSCPLTFMLIKLLKSWVWLREILNSFFFCCFYYSSLFFSFSFSTFFYNPYIFFTSAFMLCDFFRLLNSLYSSNESVSELYDDFLEKDDWVLLRGCSVGAPFLASGYSCKLCLGIVA